MSRCLEFINGSSEYDGKDGKVLKRYFTPMIKSLPPERGQLHNVPRIVFFS